MSLSADARMVLVVDDEVANAHVCDRVLRSVGYAVRTARDATEALRILEDERVDLALVDMNLADTHGLDVIKVIRARRPATTIVAMSGGFDRELINACTSEGVRAFVDKPFDVEGLLAAVNLAFGGDDRRA